MSQFISQKLIKFKNLSQTTQFQGRISNIFYQQRINQTRGSLVVKAQSGLVVKEKSSGVEFPLVRQFWAGQKCRCLGAAVRTKKIAILNLKVYVVTLYVEAELAARELGIRNRGGYFSDAVDQDYCDAIMDGAFIKCLILHMVRAVDGTTIFEALDEALTPRLSITGELGKLKELKAIFEGQKFKNGDEILLMWRLDGRLDLLINPGASVKDRDPDEFAKKSPQHSIEPSGLTRAIFEVYLGQNAVIPAAREAFAEGTRILLDTDTVKRSSQKGGSG